MGTCPARNPSRSWRPWLRPASTKSILVDNLVITSEEFARYVARNRYVESRGIVVVPENNDLMTGSYVMVDPAGRFFDNVAGTHVYSRPISQVGVDTALREVSVDTDKFRLRDGVYEWRRA